MRGRGWTYEGSGVKRPEGLRTISHVLPDGWGTAIPGLRGAASGEDRLGGAGAKGLGGRGEEKAITLRVKFARSRCNQK